MKRFWGVVWTTATTLLWLGALAAGAVLLVAWWKSPPDHWMGFVYPGKLPINGTLYIYAYPTLDACRLAAVSEVEHQGGFSAADYECGLNCRPVAGKYPHDFCEDVSR